jgi:hypothetical protein
MTQVKGWQSADEKAADERREIINHLDRIEQRIIKILEGMMLQNNILVSILNNDTNDNQQYDASVKRSKLQQESYGRKYDPEIVKRVIDNLSKG